MTSRTRTQITIHTRKTIVIRPLGGESFPAWWEQCLEVVPGLTQETVAGLLQLPTGTLNDLLIGGELHAVAVGGRSPSEIISEVSNKLRRSGTIPGR